MPQEFLFFFQLPKWYLLCFNFVILIAYNLTPSLVFQCLRPLQCSCKMVLFFACVDGIQYSLLVTRWYRRPISYVKNLNLYNARYAWILLVLFQFLASNVSLLGHLCGILSGFACLSFISFLFVNSSRAIFYFLIIFLAKPIYLAPDTYGLFNYLLPGPSFYSKIEGLSALVSFA